jgi:ABC-2 type transport system permease protein
MKTVRDTWLIFVRSLMLTLRNPVWVFIGLMQPILYLALFAPLLEPITSAPGFPPGAMLLGRALRDVAILLVQAALTIEPGGFIIALVLLALLGLIMTTFSYTVALAVKSEDVLAPVINAVFLPVLLLSGILLPMALAPKWLQWVAAFNPFSHAVDAMRSLFAGAIGNGTVALGVGLMLALTVISLFFAGRAFSKSQA